MLEIFSTSSGNFIPGVWSYRELLHNPIMVSKSKASPIYVGAFTWLTLVLWNTDSFYIYFISSSLLIDLSY